MRLEPDLCRRRQKRLLEEMRLYGTCVAVLGDPKHVLYLSGYATPPYLSSAVVLEDDGTCTLVAPDESWDDAVDRLETVELSHLATMALDPARTVAERAASIVGHPEALIGLDKEGAPAYLADLSEGCLDLSPTLHRLRRKKDPDELVLMKEAIRVTHACYEKACRILEPGVSELDVYSELYATAVASSGQKLPAMGNDFQCNSPGGPPRERQAKAGELYILDLGVEVGGYFADNCRTFAVDGDAAELQRKAWKDLVAVFDFVEDVVRPGYSCKKLYQEVHKRLDQEWPGAFFHHLGHGVGLSPHEQPNLNPHWSHQFEEGDVFTVEPGVYREELRAGIRLEENYRVTERGVEKLTSFPLDL